MRVPVRGARLLLAACVLLLSMVIGPALALADSSTGTAAWSQLSPSSGAIVSPPGTVSIRVDAASNLSGASFLVDGVAKTATINYPVGHWGIVWVYDPEDGVDYPVDAWVVDDYSIADLVCAPGVLTSGSHSVTASVTTASSGQSTYAWSFGVNTYPTVSAVTPLNGSTVFTKTPAISATVADDDLSFTAAMTVDGASVIPIYDMATKTFSYTPSTPIADLASHTASITVTDPRGQSVSKSWTFSTHAAPYVSAPVPAAGTNSGVRPTLSVTATDNAAGTLGMDLKLDGASVFSGQIPQGVWNWTPGSDLAAGSHTAVATVTDAEGNPATLTWSFTVIGVTFSAQTPTPGSTGGTPAKVSAHLVSPTNITGATMKLDGVAKATTVSYPIGHWDGYWEYNPDYDEDVWIDVWVVDDYKVADVSVAPGALGTGTHTTLITATTGSGTVSEGWSFNVNTVPVIAAVTPADGSVIGTAPPVISAKVTDDDSMFTATMTVDGATVLPTYNAATKTYSYTPPAALADWSSHTASITVKDPGGLSVTKSWAFRVHVAPKLTALVPADNSDTTSYRPAIGLTSVDNVAGNLTMVLKLDGSTVFTGSIAQGAWTWTPPADLVAGTHAVVATVTDAQGYSTTASWSFRMTPIVFTQPLPVASTIVPSPGTVSIRADAGSNITTATMVVNGLTYTPTLTYPVGHWGGGQEIWDDEDGWIWIYDWIVDDYTVVDLACPPAVLPSGVRTASATVSSVSHGTSTYTWQFEVNDAPVVSAVTPASSPAVPSLQPAITAKVTDDDSTFAANMTVDGVAVTPSFDAATKTYSYTPSMPLSDWSSHTAAITVTDPHGRAVTRTWTFTTYATPKLTVPVPAESASTTDWRQKIGVTIADGSAGHVNVKLTLDGTVVYNASAAQGAWTWTPTTDLAIGSHSASVEVTDADGYSATRSWTFSMVPIIFSAQAPTAGTTIAAPSAVSVRADAGSNITDAYFLIDGVSKAATITYPVGHWTGYWIWDEEDGDIYISEWVIDDYTVVDMTCAPGVLASGSHNVTATVSTVSSGIRSSAWSFSVSDVPVISTVTPSAGTTVGTLTPAISAQVVDDDSTFTTTMKVDNVAVTPVYNASTKTYTYTPILPLSDWATHTVTFTVKDPFGLSATKTWSFSTHKAPRLTSPTPTNNMTTTRPAIGLIAVDNVAGPIRMHLYVDGISVFDGQVAQGAWGWTPTNDLLIRQHSARAEVTDADGNTTTLAWSFGPKIMTASSCGTCHPGNPLPAGHGSWCTDCHAEHGYGGDCGECHGEHDLSACSSCHGHSDATLATQHASTTAGCGQCHDSDLMAEHSRYPSSSSSKYDCATCHSSTDAQVAAAIAAKKTNCDACHSSADHTTVHAGTPRAECSQCHDANLVAEHVTKRGKTCQSCHSSADAAVSAAIVAGNKECSACHAAGGGSGHESLHDTSNLDSKCTTCHSNNLVSEHLNNSKTQSSTLTCDTCHASTSGTVLGSIAAGDMQCFACHRSAHGSQFAETVPSDIALYPGTTWSWPEKASLFAGQSWLPDLYASGGKILISKRRADITGDAVAAWYQSTMTTNGWTRTSAAPSAGSQAFSIDFAKGERKMRVWFYAGPSHDAAPPRTSGSRIEVMYR